MTVVVPNVPTPVPSRADPVNFAARADAYHEALPSVVDAMNLQNEENNSLNAAVNVVKGQVDATKAAAVSETTTIKNQALAAQAAAEVAAANAAAANGGQLWVSGTTYAVNALVYSPLTRRSYRRLVAGAGTTDPSNDPTNWGLLSVVVEQSDIGTAPNQVPLNQYLGALAYMDSYSVHLEPGAGITLGSGTIFQADFINMNGVKRLIAIIDIRGLKGGTTAGDIIGSDSTAVNSTKQAAFLLQMPQGFNALGGVMRCLELPAGGSTSIGLFSAVEGTGLQDQAVSDLTETSLIATSAQALATASFFSATPAATSYLYLVSGGTTNAAYTAGRFLIEIYGV